MSTYKEQQENRYDFVLLKGQNVLGTFGNLRKLVDFIKDEDFPSYWTLIRKKDFPVNYKNYKICRVKHY